MAQRFVERHCKPNLRTWQEIEQRIGREILPRWGKRSITSITSRDVAILLDDIVDRGIPVTANRTLAIGRRLFGWARERHLIETSPSSITSRPQPGKRRVTASSTMLSSPWCGAPPK